MKRYNVLGTKVSATNLTESVSYFLENIEKAKNTYVCCANVHTVITAYENIKYQNILNNSFITLPDGGPIAKEAHRDGLTKVEKVSGVDFFEKTLEKTKQSGIRHYFYGNTKENLETLISSIQKKYPNLIISGYEASVFRELSDMEIKEVKEKIISSKADIVWVSLGAPKQEFFCERICKNSNACFVAVGGAFNIVAGITRRAPKWMKDNSLEWLYRLIKEPKRLYKRYFVTNTKYLIYRWKNNT